MTEEKEEKKELERIIVKCGKVFPNWEGQTIVTRKTATVPDQGENGDQDQGYTFEFDMPLTDCDGWEEIIKLPAKVAKGKLSKTVMHAEAYFTPTVKDRIKAGQDIDSEEAIAIYLDGIASSLEYAERSVSKATKIAEELAEEKAKASEKDVLMKKMLGLAPDCTEEEYIQAMAKFEADNA